MPGSGALRMALARALGGDFARHALGGGLAGAAAGGAYGASDGDALSGAASGAVIGAAGLPFLLRHANRALPDVTPPWANRARANDATLRDVRAMMEQDRVARPPRETINRRIINQKKIDYLDRSEDIEPASLDYIIGLGRDFDGNPVDIDKDALAQELGPYGVGQPRQHHPLLGGAPDPSQVRKLLTPRPEPQVLNLPDDPARWREALGQHPWVNSPSRAQLVIMANAKNADGTLKFTNEEITERTRIKGVGEALKQARNNGVHVVDRRQARGGRTDVAIALMLRAAKMGAPMSHAAAAERAGLGSKEALASALHDIRNGTSSPHLRKAVEALDAFYEKHRRGGRQVKHRLDDTLTALLPYLVTGGGLTAIWNAALASEQGRHAILGEMEQS